MGVSSAGVALVAYPGQWARRVAQTCASDGCAVERRVMVDSIRRDPETGLIRRPTDTADRHDHLQHKVHKVNTFRG